MNEQEKMHALCYNTKTGQIYIYPKGVEYKKFILKSDNCGYFFKNNKVTCRINNKSDIDRIKEFINN